MPKHRNAHKKFNFDKNRRRAYHKKKKGPFIGCEAVKKAWDENKSVMKNLKEMGLSADPNKTLRIETTKERLTGQTKIVKSVEPVKTQVIKELEQVASAEQPLRLDMSDPDIQYCVYLLDKYGEDYVAMARDRRNVFQETPKQIKKKISKFRSIPKLYNSYLQSKEHGVSA